MYEGNVLLREFFRLNLIYRLDKDNSSEEFRFEEKTILRLSAFINDTQIETLFRENSND